MAEPRTARLEARRPQRAEDDDVAIPHEPSDTMPAVAWGTDDPGPAAPIALAADLPAEPVDDADPLTHDLFEAPQPAIGDDLASVVAVRFMSAGRLSWFDAGDGDYALGERVMVDAERGARLAWVAIAPTRRTNRDRLRRVIRRANDQDLRQAAAAGDVTRALRLAKDAAAKLIDRDGRALMKVFRVELGGPLGRGGKLLVYYTTDDRLDLREFIRDLGAATNGGRIELRQLGVRDEAKAVGGIGSCGLTLCCTTWMPDFVPVSIKMAKDQGLVLSPTKVLGQCGRLKCCLVYEQAGYAELRKGLPKLGKRVISARGEGRVVEVDVLRQRVRVSYGMGDSEVLPAGDVKPMFPPGGPQRAERDDIPDDPSSSGELAIPADLAIRDDDPTPPSDV